MAEITFTYVASLLLANALHHTLLVVYGDLL